MTTPLTLSAQDITRRHDRRMVVDSVTLTLRRGEVLGLLGHNGAGKSTTLQMLCGALPPNSGKIEVCGFDMRSQPLLAKACIGFLPEHPPLYRDLAVDTQLIFAARLHRVPATLLAERLLEAKQRCGLADCGKKFIGTLSKGYQQRVGIAQAIIHKPAVVILDEPTVGLDPSQIRDIRSLIRELGDRSSVILSTHFLNEVENLCDRVAVMQHGRLIFNGSSDEMRLNGSIEDVFMQLNAQPTAETPDAP
jgi:ABC-2 type transport system ATP-binding protein